MRLSRGECIVKDIFTLCKPCKQIVDDMQSLHDCGLLWVARGLRFDVQMTHAQSHVFTGFLPVVGHCG